MSTLRVFLFGKLSVQSPDGPLPRLDIRKVQELLCYLLVFRGRPHPRETLAGNLWGENPTSRSKKYLRQSLWMLQSALDPGMPGREGPLLLVDDEWVQMNPQAEYWLDVAEFEKAFQQVQATPARQIGTQDALALRCAASLYRGDFLDGWYQDWCIFERERLQNMYLAVLEKLSDYSEVHQEYENGQDYSTQILHYDPASERTHARMMRMYYLSGDRTEALRQYERCVAALKEELGVAPSRKTWALYEQIRVEQFSQPDGGGAEYVQRNVAAGSPQPSGSSLAELFGSLREFQDTLLKIQAQLQVQLEELEQALRVNQ